MSPVAPLLSRPATRNGWKTCSRGHKFRGPGPCARCWPGRAAPRAPDRTAASSRTAAADPGTAIDAYIGSFAPAMQQRLQRLRAAIRAAAPHADERISYRMPAFFEGGRALAYYGGFKTHIGLFPPVRGDAALVAAAAPYAGPKGNLRFPMDAPLPYALVRRIVKARRR